MANILKEYRIISADVRINCDATADDLIDVIEGNRIYSMLAPTFAPLSRAPLCLFLLCRRALPARLMAVANVASRRSALRVCGEQD